MGRFAESFHRRLARGWWNKRVSSIFLQKPFPLFYFVHFFSRFDIEFHFHEVGKVTDVWISQKYGFAYVEMEDQK